MNNLYSLNDQYEWDAYWNKKEKQTYLLYDAIAYFYRNNIIKPSLSYYLKKIFKENSFLLHAGCGSGQVDENLSNNFCIHAMDISKQALICYKKSNHNTAVFQGNIFNIPAKDETYDGIYNLGVMEHFYEQDLLKILKEFNRVLKSGGVIVLF